jgi:hypothetical protein
VRRVRIGDCFCSQKGPQSSHPTPGRKAPAGAPAAACTNSRRPYARPYSDTWCQRCFLPDWADSAKPHRIHVLTETIRSAKVPCGRSRIASIGARIEFCDSSSLHNPPAAVPLSGTTIREPVGTVQARDLEVTQQAAPGQSTRFALQKLSPADAKKRVATSVVR